MMVADVAIAMYDGGWRPEDKEEFKRLYQMTEEEASDIAAQLQELNK